jgi:hypothetical protein
MHRSSYPPQPDDDMTTDVSYALTQEMEIALSYLRMRFNEYTMDEIMLSLIQHS